ncbi:hypothetical protein FKP32DRAFT_972802 [Trametes sanguinea]|nr:hypothetical protein FKP32DRAFT_972802 [Trametes sanguinea]
MIALLHMHTRLDTLSSQGRLYILRSQRRADAVTLASRSPLVPRMAWHSQRGLQIMNARDLIAVLLGSCQANRSTSACTIAFRSGACAASRTRRSERRDTRYRRGRCLRGAGDPLVHHEVQGRQIGEWEPYLDRRVVVGGASAANYVTVSGEWQVRIRWLATRTETWACGVMVYRAQEALSTCAASSPGVHPRT